MNAKALNVPLVLEAPDRIADGMGGYLVAWRALGVVYARMRAGQGAVRLVEVGPTSAVKWQITTRGAPPGDPRRPAPDQRFRMGQRLFRIEAVAEDDAMGRYLTAIATEESMT